MRTRSLWWLCSLFVLVACQAPIQAPPDFVVLKDAGEGHRLITADDARLRVRELREETDGVATFWSGNLRREFEERGHRFVAEGDVQDADGVAGRWLEFEVDDAGARAHLLVALWPRTRGLLKDRHSVQVVEFLARDEVYTQRVAAVRAAFATVRR